MAISESHDDNDSSLPPQPIYIQNNRSSSGLRTGIGTPTYTIQEDPPWTARATHAPAAFSHDSLKQSQPDAGLTVSGARKAMETARPSFHAHPHQQILDQGPQIRQSRLPIFKQVRSMLHKPPPLVTPESVKWDEYSGELSENGKPAQVKPSAYVPPYANALKVTRRRSPERTSKPRKSASLVSVLSDEGGPEEEEVKPPAPLKIGRNVSNSPPSPISPVSPIDDRAPSPVSVNSRTVPSPAQTPTVKAIKRKPAPSSMNLSSSANAVDRQMSGSQHNDMPSSQVENHAPPRSPSQDSNWTEPPEGDFMEDPSQHPHHPSHFSWTTYAPSVANNRPSMDATSSRLAPRMSAGHGHNSRFSWSTVNTNVTRQLPPDSPPSGPPPAIPAKYNTLRGAPAYDPARGPPVPVQSILSRRRPVQKFEKEEWAPPPRQRSAGPSQPGTPVSGKRIAPLPTHPALRHTPSPAATTRSNISSSKKALPPPPELLGSPATPMTHLESLLAQERDLIRQRRNVEWMIAELDKVDKASPLDVAFAQIRENKKKMKQAQKTLAEVLLEEREIGIMISRARRKEGEEEGLWVRRVTG